MIRGRKPKPSALHELQGTRNRRKNTEPRPSGIPTCPKHLDRVAKAEWKRISEELISVGLLTSADRAALAAYCVAYSRWARAEAELQRLSAGDDLKSLLTIAAKSKFPIAHPLIGISNAAAKLMKEYLVEFGLTPASRTRLTVDTAPASADPFSEFMSSLGAEDVTETIADDIEETIVQ